MCIYLFIYHSPSYIHLEHIRGEGYVYHVGKQFSATYNKGAINHLEEYVASSTGEWIMIQLQFI